MNESSFIGEFYALRRKGQQKNYKICINIKNYKNSGGLMVNNTVFLFKYGFLKGE